MATRALFLAALFGAASAFMPSARLPSPTLRAQPRSAVSMAGYKALMSMALNGRHELLSLLLQTGITSAQHALLLLESVIQKKGKAAIIEKVVAEMAATTKMPPATAERAVFPPMLNPALNPSTKRSKI